MDDIVEQIKQLDEQIKCKQKRLKQLRYIDTSFLKDEIREEKKQKAHLEKQLHDLDTKDRR